MPNLSNRIGIEIDARATGGQGIREQLNSLRELHQVSGQFESLRMEAAEKYPDQLDKQNQYIREQLTLLKQLESVGSRRRVSEMQDQMRNVRYFGDRRQIEMAVGREQVEHRRAGLEFSEAELARRGWAEQEGLTGVSAAAGEDVFAGMAMAGGRGGISGIAGYGLGRAGEGLRGMMGGMGGAAKIATGAGIGALIYGAYKAFDFIRDGWNTIKSLQSGIFDVLVGLDEIPRTEKGRAEFRHRAMRAGVGMGLDLQTTLAMGADWMRLGGIRDENVLFPLMEGSVTMGRLHGIDPQRTTGFLGQMARMGLRPNANIMSENTMRTALAAADRAGLTGLRRSEFIDQVTSMAPTVLQTAVTADPEMLIGIAERFAMLGLPFQGERGGRGMTQLHGAITGGQGISVEVARRILVARGDPVTLPNIRRQQELGVTDPANMRGVWGLAMELGGGDPMWAAYIASQQTGLASRLWWDEKRLTPRLGDLFAAGMGDEFTKDRMATIIKELTPEEKARQDEQIAAMEGTPQWQAMVFEVVGEISKIESAALAFDTASTTFKEAVNTMVDRLMAPEEELRTKYWGQEGRERETSAPRNLP